MTVWQIFTTMLMGGLASIGGGSGTLAVAHHAWVESGLLDPALFAWSLALGHITPGPLSTSMVGMGYFLQGVPGAMAAIVGVNIPTWAGSVLAMRGLATFRSRLTPLLRPAGYLVAGLGAATAIRTAIPLRLNAWELTGGALVAYLIGERDVDPVWVLGVAVLIGVAMRLLA